MNLELTTIDPARVAQAIAKSQQHTGNQGDDLVVQRATIARVANALADEFAALPRFDRESFLRACRTTAP